MVRAAAVAVAAPVAMPVLFVVVFNMGPVVAAA
jgi:hypothetical protein